MARQEESFIHVNPTYLSEFTVSEPCATLSCNVARTSMDCGDLRKPPVSDRDCDGDCESCKNGAGQPLAMRGLRRHSETQQAKEAGLITYRKDFALVLKFSGPRRPWPPGKESLSHHVTLYEPPTLPAVQESYVEMARTFPRVLHASQAAAAAAIPGRETSLLAWTPTLLAFGESNSSL